MLHLLMMAHSVHGANSSCLGGLLEALLAAPPSRRPMFSRSRPRKFASNSVWFSHA